MTITQDDIDAAIRRGMLLMADQHGAASDDQLLRCGVSADVRRRLVRQGHLHLAGPGVYADAASPDTWHRRAMAATLAPGSDAVLAGAAAARLHGFDGYRDVERIIVAVRHGRRLDLPHGVTLVRRRRLEPDDVTVVDGIRVLTVAATLVDLARVRHSAREQALDGALRDGHVPVTLRRSFEQQRRRGARGPAEMMSMLDQRVDARLPGSWFQRLAARLLAEHGIVMTDEHPVYDERGRLKARLDLAEVHLRVAVECQSWEWHGTPAAQRRDNLRKRWLRLRGWEVIEVWWSDIADMDAVIADILAAIDRARRMQTAADLPA